MENINFQDEIFSWKKMMPEGDDWLTTSWMRRLSMNYVNGYGLIGTVIMGASAYVGLNLQLTRKFSFPPIALLLYNVGDANGLTMMTSYRSSAFGTQVDISPAYLIKDDSLILFSGGTYGGTFYFRITGV